MDLEPGVFRTHNTYIEILRILNPAIPKVQRIQVNLSISCIHNAKCSMYHQICNAKLLIYQPIKRSNGQIQFIFSKCGSSAAYTGKKMTLA